MSKPITWAVVIGVISACVLSIAAALAIRNQEKHDRFIYQAWTHAYTNHLTYGEWIILKEAGLLPKR